MNPVSSRWTVCSFLAAMLLAGAAGTEAPAQSSSLLGDPSNRRPLSLADVSPFYQPPVEPRKIKVHDVITVLVDQKSQVTSEGNLDRRKKAEGGMTLNDWIGFNGFAIQPDPQTAGDPAISGIAENKYRAQAELDTKDAMKFSLACEVVDIRPNGTIVIEGHRSVRNNEEVWDAALTGVIRPEDLLPNNTVKSENIAELRLDKREMGHVRDAYRRGWIQKFFDRFQLF
jgi:flagellar L-ring protein precursor FlgH